MASDLHTHTIFSDGSLSPEELLATAKAVGLKYLAITDHDTVDDKKNRVKKIERIFIREKIS